MQDGSAGLTVGGTSAAAAIMSQTIPLRTRTRQWIESGIAKGDRHIPTWFQRRRPRRNEPPLSLRRRNNPTSMITNKTVSKRREMTMFVLLSSELSATQACRVGSHAGRSCRWISLDGRKQLRLVGYSPSRYLIQNTVCKKIHIAKRRTEGTCLG